MTLNQSLEDILTEYGANRALAYRNYGDKPPYSKDAENLKAEAKQALKDLFLSIVKDTDFAYKDATAYADVIKKKIEKL